MAITSSKTFQVSPADLTSASGVLGGAASTLSQVSSDLTKAATVNEPGFASGAALNACCQAWASGLQAAASNVQDLSGRLTATAAAYTTTEDSITQLNQKTSTLLGT